MYNSQKQYTRCGVVFPGLEPPVRAFRTMGAIPPYMRLVANVSLKQRDRPVADGENDSGELFLMAGACFLSDLSP